MPNFEMKDALYDHLKTGALVFERKMGLVEVTGPDRVNWLQGMVSNDVGRLRPGQGCYAAHLSPQGRVLSQMAVLVRGDSLWLEMEQDNVEASVRELDRLLIMEDAALRDRSSEFAILAVAGTRAQGILEQALGGRFVFEFPFAHADIGGAKVVRAELGYDLIVRLEELSQVRAGLESAGAGFGDRELWECLRIEAGLPTYGVDIDSTTTLPELGDKGIDYEKGCYIGQEVVAKIRYIGHVNRRFVGLKCAGSTVPGQSATIRRGDRDVGRTTSSAYSPALESAVCLGYVRIGADIPGTEVEVCDKGESQTATVSELPLVGHEY